MAIDQDILTDDLTAVISDMPVTATLGDDSVSCNKSTLAETDRAAAAGELEDYVFSIHSVAADWTTAPVLGDLITIDSIEYRVLRIVNDCVGMRFDLGAKYSDRTSGR